MIEEKEKINLIIKEEADIKYYDESNKKRYILEIFIILCGVFSNVFINICNYNMMCNYFIIIMEIIVFSIISFCILYKKNNLIKKLLVYLLLVVSYCAYNFKAIVDGSIIIINKIFNDIMLDKLSKQTELICNSDVTTTILLYIVIISLLITMVVRYKQSIILTLIIMSPSLVGIYYGILPPTFLCVIFSAFIISIISMSLVKIDMRLKTKDKTVFINRSSVGKSGIVALVLSLIIFMSISMCYPEKKYERIERLDIIEDNIEFFVNNISLSSFIAIFNSTAHGGLDNGELGNVDKLIYDNKTDLKVTMIKDNNIWNNLGFVNGMLEGSIVSYLPAFRGDEYNGNSWSEVDESDIEEKLDGYNLMNINSDSCNYLMYTGSQFDNMTLGLVRFNVENVGANKKYLYAPYNSVIDSKYNLGNMYSIDYYEAGLQEIDQPKESYEYYEDNMDKLYEEKVNEYLEREKEYRNYVYKEYVKYPEGLLNSIEEKVKDNRKNHTMQECINIAKGMCQEGTQYSLEPGRLPYGKDFVEYFLTENKKGYCSHYASAATIILRMMGIPTRYVEGYVIRDSDIEDNDNKSESNNISVKQYYRHGNNELYFNEKMTDEDLKNTYKINILGKEVELIAYYDDNRIVEDELEFEQISNKEVLVNGEKYSIEVIVMITESDGSGETVMYETAINPEELQDGQDYSVFLSKIIDEDDRSFIKDPLISDVETIDLNVTDASAHAWVEVYIDNYGWLPIDVTPDSDYDTTHLDTYANKNEDTVNDEEVQDDNIDNTNEIEEENNNENTDNISDVNINNKNIEESNNNLVFIYSAVLICLLLISFIGIILRRYIIIRKRENLANSNNRIYEAIELYKYIKNVIEFMGVRIEDYDSELKLAKEIEDKFQYINDNELIKITEVVLKIKYGNDQKILNNEIELLRKLSKNISRESYKMLSRRKKIIFKFKKCYI